MKHEQQMVRDWMARFGQETHNCNPVIPSLEIRKLRAKLILEEALETIAGLGFSPIVDYQNFDLRNHTTANPDIRDGKSYPRKLEPNLIEIADGIADSLVVLLGTAAACGIDIKPVFDEVMRSNESKLWSKHDMELSKNDDNEYFFIQTETPVDDLHQVYLVKNKDGKVIKSPSYSPANITPLLSK